MIQNEKVNVYFGSKEAYEFEKQYKRIDENALYFIEGILYSGYELYSQDYKKVSSYPSIGQKNYIYINTTNSSVAIWNEEQNEWVYLCMPVSNKVIDDDSSIATSAVVYKVLQDTKDYSKTYTDEKCNEVSKSLTDMLAETINSTVENSIAIYNTNLFAEISDKYNSLADITNVIEDIDTISVDSMLSNTSTNPVQNKVIFNQLQKYYDSSTNRIANTVLAAPNNLNGSASFRSLVPADIPDLSDTYATKEEVCVALTEEETDALI